MTYSSVNFLNRFVLATTLLAWATFSTGLLCAQQGQDPFADTPLQSSNANNARQVKPTPSFDELLSELKAHLERSIETRIRLQAEANHVGSQRADMEKQSTRYKNDIERLKPLLEEAKSGNQVVGDKAIPAAKVQAVAIRLVKDLQAANNSERSLAIVAEKLNAMVADLKSTTSAAKQKINDAKATLARLNVELKSASNRMEALDFYGQQYLEKGMELDLAIIPEERPQAKPTAITSGSNRNLKAMVAEFYQMADQLELNGEKETANTLREKANRLARHLDGKHIEVK